MAFVAAGQVTAARAEEATGRLEHLLVRPVARSHGSAEGGWWRQRWCWPAGCRAGIVTWLGAASQHAGVSFPALLGAGLNIVPPALVILGIGGLAAGIWPRSTPFVIYGVLGWSLLIEVIGGVGALEPLGPRHLGVPPDGLGPGCFTGLADQRGAGRGRRWPACSSAPSPSTGATSRATDRLPRARPARPRSPGQSTLERNAWVRWCWGEVSTCPGIPALDHDAVVHEYQGVPHLAGEAHLVGDHDHGHAVGSQAPHHVEHVPHQLGVEGRGGLVEEHELGRHGQGPGDGHPLLLAAGQLVGVRGHLVGQSHPLEELLAPAAWP